MAMYDYKDFTSFKLNEKLVKWAYNLSKDVKLDDCKEAQNYRKLYKTSAYSNTEMEDSAVALVLKNFGYLDHYLVSRDIVNFDQPHTNQTIKESLDANSGSFSIGMSNGYKVASKVTNYIVSNWNVWEKGIPELKNK